MRHLLQWERFRRPRVTPPPNGWDSQQDGHSLSSRDFWSQKQRGILRLLKWSVVREHQSTRAHGSPSHQGRLRLQVENVHNQLQTILEISMTDVLTWTLTLNGGCSSLHINFVDVFFFIESLFSWCCPTWPSSSNAASIPVQAILDPFYMTARVK